MLVQFSFENYKSFKDETKLSMVASNYFKENSEYLVETEKYALLKSAAVLGANASGKSKLFDAFKFMCSFIMNSSKDSTVSEDIPIDPFRLNTATIDATSSFEVIFLINNIQYRYGFEVTKKEIVSEWLFKKVSKEISLFYRDHQDIEYNQSEMKKVKSLIKEDMIREKALLLSVLAQFNDELAKQLVLWFSEIKFLSSFHNNRSGYTLEQLEGPMKTKILQLMQEADFNISDFKSEPAYLSPRKVVSLFSSIVNQQNTFFDNVITTHYVYDENLLNVKDTYFKLNEDESAGTAKFFALAGHIIETLENGHVLFIDEMDAGLHSDLVVAIINLFNLKDSNPNNAQLIFNTHDTNILNNNLFRRDQFYLVSKNRYGESTLNSIADFKAKGDSNLEKRYLEGRFGAVPYLNKFGNNLKEEINHENEK